MVSSSDARPWALIGDSSLLEYAARGRCDLQVLRDTIRYDTRCYFNVRSKADISQLNLPHGNDNLKSVKTEKLKSKKTDMLRSNSKQSGKSI